MGMRPGATTILSGAGPSLEAYQPHLPWGAPRSSGRTRSPLSSRAMMGHVRSFLTGHGLCQCESALLNVSFVHRVGLGTAQAVLTLEGDLCWALVTS